MHRIGRKIPAALALAAALALTGCSADRQAEENLNVGAEALQSAAYEEALTAFKSTADGGAHLAEAYRGMGIAYMGLGELDTAVTAFDAALKETDDRMTATRKDILYYKATAVYKQGDYSGAAAVCDEILKLANEGNAHYLKGVCALEQGDKETAAAEFDSAAALNADDYDMLLNIYECYAGKNLTAEGDAYLKQALNIEGTGSESAYQKALIYYYLGEYENARAVLSSAAEAGDADAQLLMGKIYLELDDTAHARVMYQNYIASKGQTPESLNGLVLCDMAEGNYDSALSYIAQGKALAEEKGQRELAFNEIVCYEEKDDFETARQLAEQFVSDYPGDEDGAREYEFLRSR